MRTTADGSNFHVWLTDGSPTGTSLAFDRSVNCLGTLPNQLLMVAPTEPYGYADALLATDGGANAPAPLSTFDLAEGEWIGSCTPVTVGNRLFLFLEAHRGQGSSPELWVSDGTAAGTRLLAAVRLSTSTRAPAPVALGNQLYFSAGSEFLGELWTSDGTPAGTEPWTLAGEPVYPLALAVFSNRLVFAVAGVETAKLWQTDGSPGGTTPVGISTQAEQPFLVPTSNRLYFPARQAATGVELWALRD